LAGLGKVRNPDHFRGRAIQKGCSARVKVTPATPGADPGGGGPEADPLAGGLAAARWAPGMWTSGPARAAEVVVAAPRAASAPGPVVALSRTDATE